MPAIASIQRNSEAVTSGDGTTIDITISPVTVANSIVQYTTRNADAAGRVLRHMFRPSLTSPTNLRFVRTSSSFADALTIEWEVIEFDTGVLESSVQVGTSTPAGTTTDVAITPVDPANSIVLMAVSYSGNSRLQTNSFRASIETDSVTGDTLRIICGATPDGSVVGWQVVEFKPASINRLQIGTIDLSTNGSATAMISAVDLGKAVVISQGWTFSGTVAGSGRAELATYFNSDTEIEARRSTNGTVAACIAGYAVIEFADDTTTEHGTVTVPNTATVPVSQPSFTALTNGSILIGAMPNNAYNAGSDNTPNNHTASVALDGSEDGVTITRVGTSQDIVVAWSAIDWAGAGGGGDPTGTAALALSGISISASGALLVPSSAALALTKASLAAAGSSASEVTSSGAMALAAAAIQASGDLEVPSSASLLTLAAIIDANGLVGSHATAAILVAGAVIAAEGVEEIGSASAVEVASILLLAQGISGQITSSAALTVAQINLAARQLGLQVDAQALVRGLTSNLVSDICKTLQH